MDFFEQFEQSFFKYLHLILDMVRGKSSKEVDDQLIGQGRDDEEKRVLREICEEVDLEHEMMTDLIQSGEEPDQWLDHQIEEIVKESFPEATDEDIHKVKDAILLSMEKGIEFDVTMLEKEVDVILSAKQENDDSLDKSQGSEEGLNHE